MTARKRQGAPRRKPAPGRVCGCGVAVGAEERRHLVEVCAFFRADRYRAAEPGRLRAQDFEDAALDIDAALGRRKRPLRAARPRRQFRRAGNV